MATKREREDEEKKARLLALVGAGASHFREAQGVREGSQPEPGLPAEPQVEVPPVPVPVKKPLPKPIEAPKQVAKGKTTDASERPRPESQGSRAEEPAFGPEPDDPAKYLVKRRRSLREDSEWIGTTLYLRRETHAALQKFCHGAGLDMSRVVQYCVSLQMDERQRSPVLTQLLGE